MEIVYIMAPGCQQVIGAKRPGTFRTIINTFGIITISIILFTYYGRLMIIVRNDNGMEML
jgi:hypothetical protein